MPKTRGKAMQGGRAKWSRKAAGSAGPSAQLLLLGVALGVAAAPAVAGPPPHAGGGLIARAAATPHPRLLAGAADIARVKALTSEHPLARRLLARLVAEESSLAMVSDGRSTASTIVDCALLWRLSGNASWAAKGLAVVEAEANARTEWPSSASEYLDWGDLMHGLAIGYDWLYPVMTAEQRGSVAGAINRSFADYTAAASASPETFYLTHDNWNAVVNGAAAMASLAVASEHPATAGRTLSFALAGLQRAMATLGDDGSWPEGQVYTQYAAISLAHVASALETATGSSAALTHRDRLEKLPLFLVHQNAPSQRFFDWADTDMPPVTADSYGHSVLMQLAQRAGSGAYAFAARQLAASFNSTLDPHWLRFFNEVLYFSAQGSQADLDALPTDALFPSHDIGMFRSDWRRNASFLGIKAGQNPDPGIFRFLNNSYGHSHLDQGSFVLESQGERFADDLGSDVYELPGYFGGGRFDYYRLNSFGHNVLIVANQSQRLGTRAPITLWNTSCCPAGPSHCKCAVVNMSDSYSGYSVRRGFGVVMGGGGPSETTHFAITDEISATASRWEAPVVGHCLGGAPTLQELHNVSVAECKAHCEALPACHGVSYSHTLSRCNVEAGAVVVPNAPWEAYQFAHALPPAEQSFVWRMHTRAAVTRADDGSYVELASGSARLRLSVAAAPMTQCADEAIRKFVVEPVILPPGRHSTAGLTRVLLRASGHCSRITVVASTTAGVGPIALNPLADWPDGGLLKSDDEFPPLSVAQGMACRTYHIDSHIGDDSASGCSPATAPRSTNLKGSRC